MLKQICPYSEEYYTGQYVKCCVKGQWFSSQRERGGSMAERVDKKSESQLSEKDTRLLLITSIELLTLCAKLAGRIDPAAAAMLAFVRDDIAEEGQAELR